MQQLRPVARRWALHQRLLAESAIGIAIGTAIAIATVPAFGIATRLPLGWVTQSAWACFVWCPAAHRSVPRLPGVPMPQPGLPVPLVEDLRKVSLCFPRYPSSLSLSDALQNAGRIAASGFRQAAKPTLRRELRRSTSLCQQLPTVTKA